jgi:hypothetical protein
MCILGKQRPTSIGVKSLTPQAYDLYVPYYDNEDQSDNFQTAKGFSYHQVTQFSNFLFLLVLRVLNGSGLTDTT